MIREHCLYEHWNCLGVTILGYIVILMMFCNIMGWAGGHGYQVDHHCGPLYSQLEFKWEQWYSAQMQSSMQCKSIIGNELKMDYTSCSYVYSKTLYGFNKKKHHIHCFPATSKMKVLRLSTCILQRGSYILEQEIVNTHPVKTSNQL